MNSVPRKLSIPRLVLGTGSLGNLMVASSDENKRAVIQTWIDQIPKPIAIDSAGKYGAGLALEVIGRELENLGVSPNDVVISNKLAWRRKPLTTPEPTFEPGVWIDIEHDAVQDISAEGIRRCWEEGNQLLGSFNTDLLSVHDPDEYLAGAANARERDERLQQILDAYAELAKIRDSENLGGIGVGSKDWKVIRELDQHVDFDWVMIANSLTVMSHPVELLNFLDHLSAKGCTVINSAVLHGGFLTGGDFCDYKPIDPADPEDAKKLKWRDSFRAICQSEGVGLFHAAVNFGLALPSVSSVALSSSNPRNTASMVTAVHENLPTQFWQRVADANLLSADSRIMNQLLS